MAIAHSHQRAFDSIWREDHRGLPGLVPADLLYLTPDLCGNLGILLIADLLARPIAQRKREREQERESVFLEILFRLYFSVLGTGIYDDYMLDG